MEDETKQPNFAEEMKHLADTIEVEDSQDQKIIEEKEQEDQKKIDEDIMAVFNLIEKEHGITKEQIENWKADFAGKVFAVRFDENEAYIFRYVALPEWKKIIRQVSESKASNTVKEEMVDDLLVTKCVLYPKITEDVKALLGAGTIGTLAIQIKVASNFIHESVALDMITKL